MIPYPYNMVDMGGIDLAEANGTVVDGLYAKIVEAVNACGDVVLYNWKFAGIEIAPQHTSILLGDPITINGAVQVTEQDAVTVPGINPEPPEPPPPPVLVPLSVTENGQYRPEEYEADGFSIVDVNVESDQVATPGFYVKDRIYLEDNKVWGFVSADCYIVPRSVRQNVIPDWREPFEIGILFSYSSLLSRSQVLIGAIGLFYYAPSIELGPSGNIWAGISTGGSSWDRSLNISNTESQIQPNQPIFVLLSSNEGIMTLSVKIGDTVITKNTEVSTPFFNGSPIEFGGVNHSSSHCATNVTIDLSGTYIKQNDVLVWGNQSTTI